MNAAVLALAGALSAASGVSVERNAQVNGSACDVLTWCEAGGDPRSVAIVAGKDREGFTGGYAARITYRAGNTERSCNANGGSLGGFGHVVCHGPHDRGWINSKEDARKYAAQFLFEGEHHAIWRAEYELFSKKGNFRATVDWFVRSGRSDFVYAVTFDTTDVKDLGADTRTPYGEFDWEGNGSYGDRLSGFGWAAANRKFRTKGDGLSQGSAWDWTEECAIPHVIEWKSAAAGDAEMGLVQTQAYAAHDAGAGWWHQQGKSGAGLPENWNCTYQLNCYQGYASKKLTWMMPYGAVGNAQYDVFDYSRKASGHPFQSYSLLCVLGKHSDGGVDATVAEMVTAQTKAKLTAAKGKVALEGPGGAGRSDNVRYSPAGWDHVYACWTIECSGSAADCALEIAAGELPNPTFCFTGYTKPRAPASFTLDGKTLSASRDLFASVDAKGRRLFVTLARNLTAERHALAFR